MEPNLEEVENTLLTVTISTDQVLELVSRRISEEIELPPGDTAGPQPCPDRLAAVAITALSEFGLLDGSHYRVVKAAMRFLEE